jgi:hypothetical protein
VADKRIFAIILHNLLVEMYKLKVDWTYNYFRHSLLDD